MKDQERVHVKRLYGTSLFLGLALFALVSPARAEECARIHEVQITFENATGFKPKSLVVKAGDCVRWVNVAFDAHSVVAVDRSFQAGMLQNGADAIIAFNKPGVYPYFCGPHPPMKGEVIVEP